MGLKKMDVRVKSAAPMLQHSQQTMDVENEIGQAMREIHKVRGKTIEHHKELARLEWLGSLYVNDKMRVIVPGAMLEACLVAGAKKVRLGKQFLSGVFVEDDPELEFKDKKLTIEQLYKKAEYRLTIPVRVQQSRVMRTRPKFNQWSLQFTITYNDEIVEKKDVVNALRTAGQLCAIGDWRPKFGRFDVVSAK